MTRRPKNSFASTAVIQRVLPIPKSNPTRSPRRPPRAAHSGGVQSGGLMPPRIAAPRLGRAQGIEGVVPKLRFLRRTPVGQVQFWTRCPGGKRNGVAGRRSSVCGGLSYSHGYKRSQGRDGIQQRNTPEALRVRVKFSLPGISTMRLDMAVAISQKS